ncbi:MAG: RIP metalloprotease RseP [Negativicutes bacterium]|nr:RIP metalloprotease RseP [Negativicutes bacterium]
MLSTTIIATIFVIGLLVFFHELGHFITAKAVGMKVHEFALGFGPKLLSKQGGETLYSLRVIPLGGFNKIAGMDPDEEQDQFSFNAKPIWARMLVIVAGPLMNFFLPILLFVIIFLGAGIDTPSDAAVIGTVLQDRPAARVGLAAGDRVLSVNDIQIDSWRQFVSIIQVSAGKQLVLAYDRDNQKGSVTITPEFDPKANRGIIGVVPLIVNYRPGPLEAVSLACQQVYAIGTSMLSGIGQMITGRAPADVAGPIGVAQMAGQVAQMGILPLLQFSAFLSINLGLINLLPVPVLDGGHIVTLAVEAVRRKPLSPQKMQYIQMIGFTLLMLLLLLATFKDITRLKLF